VQPQLSLAVRWHAKVGLAAGVLRGPWWRKARGCWYQLFGISIWNIYGNVFTPNPKTLLSGQMSNPGHCHLQLTVQVFFVTWKFHVIFHWYSIEKHTPYIYIYEIYIYIKIISYYISWVMIPSGISCGLLSFFLSMFVLVHFPGSMWWRFLEHLGTSKDGSWKSPNILRSK
jgi:hypothetical protein